MTMSLELKTLSLNSAALETADLVIALLAATPAGAEKAAKTTKAAATLAELVTQAEHAGDVDRSTAGSQLQLYSLAQTKARRVVLIGAGNGSPQALEKALQAASGVLRAESVKKAVIVLDGVEPNAEGIHALVHGIGDIAYTYTHTRPQAKAIGLQKVTLGVPNKAKVQAAFETAQAIVAGVTLAREWGNRPANHATPTHLAQAAKALAKGKNITAKVLGRKEITQLKMGSFLSVAQGSVQEPQFIELHYQGGAKTEQPLVLIGKGVTFDTGGISIKPAAGMDEMKFDMCGAASVLGVFEALAQLQPKINVVGLIAATENMPSGSAIKPGDVVTSMSGQTIEILNTDAEGRLILCDAITYADRFKPRAVVDIATLTGACVIALGGIRSGLYANDEALASALLSAGEQTQDLGWRMPLDADYASGLKSNFADVANVAGREGGSVTAAKFLERFVGQWPWAHLDIAGTAWKSGAAKGATGRPVGLLTQWILGQAPAAQKSVPAPAARTTKKAKTPVPKV